MHNAQATTELIHMLRGIRVSKHRQFDKDGEWIPGKVTIGPQSNLRKLMRAARRSKMPPERQFIIDEALKSAHRRRRVYMSRSAREMDMLTTLLASRP